MKTCDNFLSADPTSEKNVNEHVDIQQVPNQKTLFYHSTMSQRGHTLGCNNGRGGFHENLVTFKRTKLPDFSWAQKMRLKKCSS